MIREVHEQDACDIAELLRQLRGAPAFTQAELDALKVQIAVMTRLDHMKVFGFEQEGKLVGTCTLGKVEGLSYGCRPFAIIENVVVLATMRSQGIGQ